MIPARGKIFVLSGPSGSGKTTLYQKLLKDKSLHLYRSISCTTRKPRHNEKNGKDYFFISRSKFEKRKHLGEFLETQRVFLDYYGTPKDFVTQLLAAGKNVLLCIDVKGAVVVKRKMPEAVMIFVDVPSLKELASRLEKRSTENKRSKQIRLKVAKQELRYRKYYRHVIVNDKLITATKELKRVIKKALDK